MNVERVNHGRLQQVLREWVGELHHERILALDETSLARRSAEASSDFDLVIWSHGPARAADVPQALAAVANLMAPNGRLLIHDYLVPGNRLRGKKAQRERNAGRYINTWTRLAHPQHQRYFNADAWQDMLAQAGLQTVRWTTEQQPTDFAAWLGDAPRLPQERLRLEAMLRQAPERVEAFLTPVSSAARIAFQLTDFFILAELAQEAD
jgi:hypothetical protein